MFGMGEELARPFADAGVTKVITAEISGIAPALATAHALNVPVVYARKTRPITMTGLVYVEIARSRTKAGDVFLMVASEFLDPSDRVLVVDDFLASGATIAALARLVEHAGATVVGIEATRCSNRPSPAESMTEKIDIETASSFHISIRRLTKGNFKSSLELTQRPLWDPILFRNQSSANWKSS
ncbi:MAG: phosphoribosyltransferase family protein [Anaerolineae bacterium]